MDSRRSRRRWTNIYSTNLSSSSSLHGDDERNSERVQQRSAEKIEVVPQSPEETVEVGRLILHERVQQRTAEQIEDAPQSPAEVVEAVTSVPREQAQQRTAEKIGAVLETASQDLRLQRTVELAVGKLPFRSGFLRECVTKSAENVCCVASSCGGIG